jgi:hypothetical protein
MRFPSVRFLWDGESLGSAFGVARGWVVLDPMLRVVEAAPLHEWERVMERLDRAAPPSQAFGDPPPAPILTLADVLEPELCRHLVDCFERDGGKESGFMQDVEGRSVEHFDNGWKRRRDSADRSAPDRRHPRPNRAAGRSGDPEGVPDGRDPDRARPHRPLRC